jgi:cobalt-zinc-cadmium efflux system outer membrane protein
MTVALFPVVVMQASAQSPAQTPAQLGAGANRDSPTAMITLQQVFDSLRANNPSVHAAEARIRAAEGARRTAGAFGNPVISYQVDNTPFPGGAASPIEREAMTTATLPLEPFYQRGSRIRRANADEAAASAEAFATRQHVALDAIHAYYQTAAAEIAVDASRDLLAWLDSLVVYTQTRVREGATAEADLLRSGLERDRVSADLAMQESDLARSRANVVAFAGLNYGSALARTSVGVAIDSTPMAMPEPGNAMRSAPIEVARQQVASASAGIALERSRFVPQVGATFGTKLSGGVNTMIAGLSLPFPLFDRNGGEVARATAERDAATFELAAREREVRADVQGANEAARVLTDRAEVLSRGPDNYLARADEARRTTLGAYREGAVPLTQVLDAARAWRDARTAYFGILFAQHESVYRLSAAQGDDLLSPSNIMTHAHQAPASSRGVRP